MLYSRMYILRSNADAEVTANDAFQKLQQQQAGKRRKRKRGRETSKRNQGLNNERASFELQRYMYDSMV